MDILQPKNALTVLRGESKTLQLTVKNTDSSPKNLSGGRVVFTVKRYITDVTPIFQKTSDSAPQVTLTQPTAGIAEIYLVPADTKSLMPMEYVFDVWLILAGKQYPVILPSIFDLQPGVTAL